MSDATRRGYLASLARWNPLLASLTCDQISKSHITTLIEARQNEGVGSPAIRQDLAFLSSLLTFAMGLPNGPDTNVVRIFPKKNLPLPEERTRFLTYEEADRLLAELCGDKQRIVSLVLDTGMRRGEVLNLKKSYLHLTERMILLPSRVTKAKRPRPVPLPHGAVRTLRAQLAAVDVTCEWVFPNPRTGEPYYDPQPWFPNAVRRAGLVDFHFHDLRHTHASWWTQANKSERKLSEVLGHRSPASTRRYNHLRLKDLLDEVDRAHFPHKDR